MSAPTRTRERERRIRQKERWRKHRKGKAAVAKLAPAADENQQPQVHETNSKS